MYHHRLLVVLLVLCFTRAHASRKGGLRYLAYVTIWQTVSYTLILYTNICSENGADVEPDFDGVVPAGLTPQSKATNTTNPARSRWNRSIQVKCRCNSGCRTAVWFKLNDDVSSTYCGNNENDDGEWCWRGWFSLSESRSYKTLTSVSDSDNTYEIHWYNRAGSRMKRTFRPGWWRSKVVVGSGSRCDKTYTS
jgi:hypothetical protein